MNAVQYEKFYVQLQIYCLYNISKYVDLSQYSVSSPIYDEYIDMYMCSGYNCSLNEITILVVLGLGLSSSLP